MVLHRHERRLRNALRPCELPGVHAARPDVASLAGLDDVVERLHRLGDRRQRIPAMDLVEVDVLVPQPLERGVDRGHDVLAREAASVLPGHSPPVHLRGEHVLLARAEELSQQAAGDHLALAAVVDVGGVEEDDPALNRTAHDRLGSLLFEGPFAALVCAVAHHSEADARDPKAGCSEVDVVHSAQ